MTLRPVQMLDRLAVLVASCLFCGFFPVAPATFASAVTAILLAFCYPLSSPLVYAGVFAVLLVIGAWSAGRVERLLGHDPSAAVIDEVLGMAITMAGAPITPPTLALGFLFFRLFDILKVPPGRRLEKLPGGWGVMMDDVMAGVYAAVCLQVLLRLWPQPHFGIWHIVVAGVVGCVLFIFRKPLLKRYGKKRSHVSAVFGRGESS